jgi:RNA-directed DNA polymerase
MMYGSEKSDLLIVPGKPANKAGRSAAESVEGRSGTKGNAELQSTVRTQSRAAVSQAQDRIREAVKRNRKERLTALLHHLSVDVLRGGFLSLKRAAAAGIDAVSWDAYAQNLEDNLQDLRRRVHSGAYRALPSRRVYIPKADGKLRPLGIAAMEDKIVQAAMVMILTPIYEAEFLGFSYGFRPGRSQHDALDALAFGIKGRYVWWILDADIRRFFDSISHSWLIKFLEHRIGDRRVIRLIQKWLSAGVLEEGARLDIIEGTPQGAVISPFLANIYLHYVYDLWVNSWRQRRARGHMVVVRYADDTVVGFQHRPEALSFLSDLKERLAKFALELHPEKTRLIEFGRFAAERRTGRGDGKPETFDFLGFTHICGSKRDGKGFQLCRKTKRQRRWDTIRRIAEELRQRRHEPINVQGRWLASVLRGHYAYFSVPTNLAAVRTLRHHVKVRWYLSLARRSQRTRLNWRRMNIVVRKYLPAPTVLHPWPEERFLVTHPR